MPDKRKALGVCFIKAHNTIKSFVVIDTDLNFKIIIHNGDISYDNDQQMIGACKTYAAIFGYQLTGCIIDRSLHGQFKETLSQ